MTRLMYVLLAAGIAACGHAGQTGPAWPVPSATDEDGGESLDPRSSSPIAEAIENADEPEETAAEPADDADKPDAADPAKDDPDQSPASSEPGSDEPIMTDEIIIEIED